jgi:DNA gyrase/topoisomerase IV subunit A
MTELGKALYYPLEQISIVGKNAGGVSSNGNKDEKVACIFLNDVSKFFVTILCVQGMKRIKRDSIVQGKRTSKAKPVLSQIKTNPIIVLNAFCTNQNDIINCLFEDHK